MNLMQIKESLDTGTKVVDIIDQSIHDGAIKVLVIMCFAVVIVFGYAVYKLFQMVMANSTTVTSLQKDTITTLKETVNNNTSMLGRTTDALGTHTDDLALMVELRSSNQRLISKLDNYFESQEALKELIFDKMYEAHKEIREHHKTDMENITKDIMVSLGLNKTEIVNNKTFFLTALDALKKEVLELGEDISRDITSTSDKLKSDILLDNEKNRKNK